MSGPRNYAENDLGVHRVYEDTDQPLADLNEALDEYAKQSQRIRQANDRIEQTEYELASDLRGESPDLSQEALKRALKEKHRTDEQLVSMRGVIMDAQHKQEQAHARAEMAKYRLRVLSARMNELGGLLAFYAAVKNRPTN
jgi:hypothetical protein